MMTDAVSLLMWSSPAEITDHVGTVQRKRRAGSSTVGVLPGATTQRLYILGEN